MAIDVPVLEEHLRSLTGEPLRGSFEFDPVVNLESPSGDSVLRIAETLAHEMNRPGCSPLLLAAMKDAFLTSVLTSLRHNRIERLLAPVKKAGPTYLRKAEEFMCAHLDDPLTLTSIAREAGISVRALQAAFQEIRGCSPMQFLKERRLEHARKRLLAATPGTTVAAVAIAAGIDHLGRFSSEYKKRFGETPSSTIRKRLRVA
jgi:transcriptional regulator GlxA family with amidase domain